jgi:DNA-binding MarR family transcriptional regulator
MSIYCNYNLCCCNLCSGLLPWRRIMGETDTVTGDALAAAWHTLLERHARAHGALERALREHDLGVSEFEVLERLASAPGPDQRRMQQLGEALHLSQSALSRVVGRLEHDGLVKRGMCAEDRRGVFVCISDAGRARYEAARPAHRGALAETLG